MGKSVTLSEWRVLASRLAKALDEEHSEYMAKVRWTCPPSCSECCILLAYEEATGQKKTEVE